MDTRLFHNVQEQDMIQEQDMRGQNPVQRANTVWGADLFLNFCSLAVGWMTGLDHVTPEHQCM